MSKAKQIVKEMLQKRCVRAYRKELDSQKKDYDSWIKGREAPLLVSDNVRNIRCKCQTNGELPLSNDGSGKKNAGKNAKTPFLSAGYCVYDKNRHKDRIGTKIKILPLSYKELSECLSEVADGTIGAELLLIRLQEGELSSLALPLLYRAYWRADEAPVRRSAENTENEQAAEAMPEHPVLIYGDEDVLREGKRKQPWLKPDWSPDTFLSQFYPGSLVAVSTVALRRLLQKEPEWLDTGDSADDDQMKNKLYALLLSLIRENHGFENRKTSYGAVTHIPQVLYHTKECAYETLKHMRLPETCGKEAANVNDSEEIIVSVIIPSKDHPDILFRCLDSFLEKTDGLPINADPEQNIKVKTEFIIVDNGSSDENKRRVEEKLAEMQNHAENKGVLINNCRYLYQEEDFNFSRMCNRGAEEASGGYLLFLNDDMEIIQGNWLKCLLEKACLSYVGAVGAKLLYPQTDVIQHAGITNLRVGPAHKLQFTHDSEEHYFGKNRGVHDMLGVTGACLMVRKETFEQVGGFDEALAVAFNDVDLCYKLYEAGYYNVVRNDVVLYHHESLSRGKDGESEAKQKRLLKERELLYERHRSLYGRDPFYHPYLTTDVLETEYAPAYRYQVDLGMSWSKVRECTKEVLASREDECLVVGMECAMDIYGWKYGVTPEKRRKVTEACREDTERDSELVVSEDDFGYYFQGYSFVIGSDNACYRKELLLRKKQEGNGPAPVYAVTLKVRCREDIKDNLSGQQNVDLTGYAAKIKEGAIPAGTYQFGMLAKDLCSRTKLVNWSSWTIEIV